MEDCSSNKPLNYKLLYFTFYISLILLFEKIAEVYLKEYDLEFIKFIQQHTELSVFWDFFSYIGSKPIKLYIFPLIFCVFNFYYAFLYIAILSVSLLLTSQLKLFIQEDRPFWTNPSIIVYSCKTGYGFPSDHTLVSVPLYLFLYNITWHKLYSLYNHNNNNNTEYNIHNSNLHGEGKKAKIINGLGKILIFIIILLIGLSRVYAGAHYLYQVISGILLGFGIYMFFFSLLELNLDNYEPFLRLIDNKYFRTTIIFVFLLFYLIYLFSILFSKEQNMQEWILIIVVRCNKFPWFTPLIQGLITSTYYFLAVAALGGFYVNFYTFYGNNEMDRFIKDNITNENRLHDNGNFMNILKVLIYIIGNTCLFYLIRNFFYMIGIRFEDGNLWGSFFIEKLIPNVFAVFFICAFSKKIFGAVGIIKYRE